MKTFLTLFASAFLVMTTGASAADQFRDYTFQPEKMKVLNDAIFIISSFEREDHVGAYSFRGALLWDHSFNSKIISWEITGDTLIVFSKDRVGHQTYLTCIDRSRGYLVWER